MRRVTAGQPHVETAAGVGVSIGSHSTTAVLRAYGDIENIAFLSPYFPAANEQVQKYFEDSGFKIVREVALKCPTWTAIAEVTPDTLRAVVDDLNGPDVDALVQVGTNLPMARLAAELEQSLGKPVVAINTATYWHALRKNDITDKVAGFGRLLEEF